MTSPLMSPLRIADNVWIVDSEAVVTGALRVPVRMTVIRLSSGALLLHSPVQYSTQLHRQLERLGSLKYLLAPSVAHWMFLPQWQQALPDALTFAVPGLAERKQVRAAGLKIDAELADGLPEEWGPELDMVMITAPLYAEVALFHLPSRTLVLTDIVQNIDPLRLPPGARPIARLLGVTAPDGRAPLYLRLLVRLGGRSAAQSAARLISFAPDRVIFSHGQWYVTAAAEQQRRSLRWLTSQSQSMRGMRVVITGASSGIGRAAAVAFAGRGASVILAARREPVLQKLARECEELGGRALAVPTDVTDSDAVLQLVNRAQQTFGGIDVWINNAGTGVFGAYQDGDIRLHRRTIEVNLLGTMHGAFAVLPVFLQQRRGVLINNISLGGWAPTPFAASYTASKFGLRGFTASLRQELASYPNIHVCAVFPSMVDTPGFVHGANRSGRKLNPGPMLYQPEDVAEAFMKLAAHPRDEIAVGWPARVGQISYAMAPRPTEYLLGAVFRFLISRAGPEERTEGALLQPLARGTTASGGWLARKRLPPAGQITRRCVIVGMAGLAAVGLSTWRSRRRR